MTGHNIKEIAIKRDFEEPLDFIRIRKKPGSYNVLKSSLAAMRTKSNQTIKKKKSKEAMLPS
jgi:hypothetical protein